MPHKAKPSIVIFGGTGFLGSNFANYAARLGARAVACGTGVPTSSVIDPAVEVVELDASNLTESSNLLNDVKPDAILFGISGISPRAKKDVDAAAALMELRTLANVIQGAHECGVQQLVFCSSGGAIYGDSVAPHVETDVCRPKSLYGKLKLQAEMLVATLCEQFDMRAAVMRIGNPYGPGQSPFGLHGVIATFLYKMLADEPIKIFGSLEAAKDYVFVEDVSAAVWASIERKANGVFNIASGAPTSLQTLVKNVSEVCMVKPAMEYVDLATTEVPMFTLDIGKAKRDLQWSPAIEMDSGIAVTKRWIEETYLRESKRHRRRAMQGAGIV
jgi:UDP-glucose 4-epimerase